MLSIDPKYLQRLVESSPDIIMAVARDGTIVFYNDGARRSLGYEPEEVSGRSVTRIYPSPEEARRVMRALRQSPDRGSIANFETVFRSKAGEDIPVAVSGSLIYDDEGREIGSIGFARDVRSMLRREQVATAGEIAVSLAHEINNPLECITNNLELVARCVEEHLSNAELVVENERLDSIRMSLKRVQAIVRRLEEMARKGEYETRDYMEGKRMADLAPRETANNERTPAPALNHADRWPLSGMTVLVLDDDCAVLESLADLLRAERCVVHTASLPSQALGILRNVKVDVVVSDVVMPEMDGYEFYLRVKDEFPDLAVVLMTAYYYDKDHVLKRSRLRGLNGAIFKKPVNPAKLRQLLVQIWQKSRPPKPALLT